MFELKQSRLWLLLFALSAAIGLIQSAIVPIGDLSGAFVDETVHLRKSLDVAAQLRPAVNFKTLLDEMAALNSRVDTISEFTPQIAQKPVVWTNLLYLVQGVWQAVLSPQLLAQQRLITGRVLQVILWILAQAYFVRQLWQLCKPNAIWQALGIATWLLLSPALILAMATVSTDSMAITTSLLFCAAWLHTYQSDRWYRWLGLGLAGLLALLAKSTTLPLVVATCAILLHQWGVRWRWQAGALITAMIGVVTLALLLANWQGAAYWYYPATLPIGDNVLAQTVAVRAAPFAAEQAFLVPINQFPNYPGQYLTPRAVKQLADKQVWYGGWLKASALGQPISPPVLLVNPVQDAIHQYQPPPYQPSQSTDWVFWSASSQLPTDLAYVRLDLPGSTAGDVAYAGLFVAITPPSENMLPAENWLRNPLGQMHWPAILPGENINRRLYSLLDWERTWSAFPAAARAIYSTYWAAFAGDYPGLPKPFMLLYGVIVAASLWGWFYNFKPMWQALSAGQQRYLLWSVLVLGATMVIYVVRIDIFPDRKEPFFYATARYGYPSWLAVAPLLSFGLHQLWKKTDNLFWALVLLLLLSNLTMIFGAQLPSYQCEAVSRWQCVFW